MMFLAILLTVTIICFKLNIHGNPTGYSDSNYND